MKHEPLMTLPSVDAPWPRPLQSVTTPITFRTCAAFSPGLVKSPSRWGPKGDSLRLALGDTLRARFGNAAVVTE